MSGARGFSLPIQEVEAGGLTAWLAEDHAVPVVSVAWSWEGGAALDPDGRGGAASLAASLLTEGAGDLPATAFADRLRDAAIQLSFDADRDSFDGGFRALADALPEAVSLARLAMTAPRLDPEAVARVRARAVTGARQALETPRGQAGRAFWATAWGDHPAARPPGGTAETLAPLEAPDLRAALDRQLRRGGLLVAAAGAVTPAGLAALLPRLFDALPAGDPPGLPPAPEFRPFGRRVVPFASPQSAVVFGQPGLAVADPDWEAAQVVVRVLGGGGFSSRLMEAVRVQRGLAYGIGAGFDPVFGRGVLVGQVATENGRVGETLAVLEEEWRRMARSGPTPAELADAVAYLTGSLPLQFTDSRRTADTLLSLRRNGRPRTWLAERGARLAALTPERTAAVAARVLDPAALSVLVAGQPTGL